MSIRIIFDAKNKKLLDIYNFIKNMDFFKNHFLIVYYKQNKIERTVSNTHNFSEQFIMQDKVKYNIYIDNIGEEEYNKLPCEYTILIVNDKYLLNNHLRRENFSDEPYKILDDCVNYYFCLTKYSYNLLKKIINKKKIFLTNGLILYKNIDISLQNNKYILYNIDAYSNQLNINILTTWIKYFINRPEILIIKIQYKYDKLVDYIMELLNLKYISRNNIINYKNIILISSTKFIDNFTGNIYASIINHDIYDLIINLYKSITNNYFIMTNNNIISKELLKNNALYFDDFNENNIHNMLETLFNYDSKYIEKCINNNKKIIDKNIKSTHKILKKLLK
jgi:hypothetical protein